MRRLVQALLVVSAAHGALASPRPQEAASPAHDVDRLVAALAAPTRAERLAAQEALLALPPEAAPPLAAARPPAGFEARAALEYVRAHRPRAPRPIVVAAGRYRVGSSAAIDQNPAREVELAAFTIDDVEVTGFEWWRFTRATRTAPPPDWNGGRYSYGGESRPVGNVSPEEAERFAEWAGGRLPASDEWEAAAHGGTGLPYPWGEEFEAGRLGAVAALRAFVGGEAPEVASDPVDRSPSGGFDFCSSLMEWVKLPDGRVAARGGHYRTGAKEVFRLTRAPDLRVTQRRPVIGVRLVNRRG